MQGAPYVTAIGEQVVHIDVAALHSVVVQKLGPCGLVFLGDLPGGGELSVRVSIIDNGEGQAALSVTHAIKGIPRRGDPARPDALDDTDSGTVVNFAQRRTDRGR
jgi:hypothetical protein